MVGEPGRASGLRGRLDAVLDGLLEDRVPGGSGIVSIWYGDLDGTARCTRDERMRHYAASTMKLPLVIAAYRRQERGEIDLDREVPVHNRFRSSRDGSPFSLRQDDDQDDATWARLGSTASLRWLARQSVVRSGNLATNVLLEHVGLAAVAEVLDAAGCSAATSVRRGIEDAAAREAGMDNLVTAEDLARVMCGVAAHSLAGPASSREAEEVLAHQEHRDMVPAGLPPDTYVADKTGWVDGVAHDVALVRPERAAPYVLVVCTTTPLPEQDSQELVATVSAAVWEAHHS